MGRAGVRAAVGSRVVVPGNEFKSELFAWAAEFKLAGGRPRGKQRPARIHSRERIKQKKTSWAAEFKLPLSGPPPGPGVAPVDSRAKSANLRLMTPSKSRALILGLHLLPGLIFTLILFTVIPLIRDANINLFLTQIGLVTIFLLGLEMVIAHVYCVKLENRSLWRALSESGAVKLDWRALGAAVAWAVMAVAVMKAYLFFATPYIEAFHRIPELKLPEWHFQNQELPAMSGPLQGVLLAFMLGTNVFAEEVYFRGFLLERMKFLGKAAFVVNGLLFIAYHTFQIPVAYPLLPFGLLLSGYYVCFRTVWGSMLIHLILNLAL